MRYKATVIIITLLLSVIIFGKGNQPVLTPVLEHSLKSKKSVIYCPTFQLAWDEMKKLAGGNIEMVDAPKSVNQLNNSNFKRDDIPEEAYIAMAGYIKDGIVKKLDDSLQEKFGKKMTDMTFRPNVDATFIAFSYLYRNLPFKHKFHLFKNSHMLFKNGKKTSKVTVFGCTAKTAYKYEEDINVLYFKNKDDFMLQLQTKKRGETIILAKMPRPKTFKSAIDVARTKLKEFSNQKTKEEFLDTDTLLIPVIDFDIRINYDKLCKKEITNKNFNTALSQAYQRVKFRMNQSGAKLESEAGDCDECLRRQPRKYIFNKPFLISIWKAGAVHPYLAIWVNGTDVFRKCKKEKKVITKNIILEK